MAVFIVVCWLIAGVINLCSDSISKLSYTLMWVTLMLYLMADMVGV